MDTPNLTGNRLILNGREFSLDFRTLYGIARNFPWNNPRYLELAKEFIALKLPAITAHITQRAALDTETMDALWSEGDFEIRRRLMAKTSFQAALTPAQVEDILNAGHTPELLVRLVKGWGEACAGEASWTESGKWGARLSAEQKKALLDLIARSRDEAVIEAFYEAGGARHTAAPFLWNCRGGAGKGLRLAFGSAHVTDSFLEGMKKDDLEVLPLLTRSALAHIAGAVQRIADPEVRDEAALFLARHADPGLRLALARNRRHPEAARRLLRADPDPDIAFVAQASETSFSL